MKIVGVGCGPGMLTQEAIRALGAARLIYGSGRALDLAAEYIAPGCQIHEISDYSRLRDLPDHALVLSTGDPMLAGLGSLGGEVIPGISSMQVAFARLNLPLAQALVIDAHGKNRGEAAKQVSGEVLRGNIAFVLTDPEFEVPLLASSIADSLPSCRIAVCERLGYPDERTVVGLVTDPPEAKTDLFVLVIGRF